MIEIEKGKKGKNLGNIQEMNRALVLQTLRNRICSRADIAKSTGLQQATITNIVSYMISCGIVKETGLIKGQRGRRSIGLEINSQQYHIIGLRLTRKFILAGLYDIAGTEYHLLKQSIDVNEGVQVALDKIRTAIQNLLSKVDRSSVLGIGIGLPGPFLRQDGKIALMADFPGWEGISLKDFLEHEFHIAVYQVHDAYASALAEWWFGGQRGDARILLSISMEQGIGAGLVADNNLYYGSQGIAGEIGHITIDYNGIPCNCGNKGCLRGYCTGYALTKTIRSKLPEHPESSLSRINPNDLDLDQILDAAKSGDSFALSHLRETATFLGYGIINTIYAYNPNLIILSGEFSKVSDIYLEAINETLKEHLLPILRKNLRIVFSTIKNDNVLMGTAALVIDWIFQNPSLFFSGDRCCFMER